MVTFNQVTFVGNVGSDVDMHTAGTGKNYTRFRLAVDSFSSKDNDTPPLWLSVVAWDKLAEQVESVSVSLHLTRENTLVHYFIVKRFSHFS